jgi:hypothetical protein
MQQLEEHHYLALYACVMVAGGAGAASVTRAGVRASGAEPESAWAYGQGLMVCGHGVQ